MSLHFVRSCLPLLASIALGGCVMPGFAPPATQPTPEPVAAAQASSPQTQAPTAQREAQPQRAAAPAKAKRTEPELPAEVDIAPPEKLPDLRLTIGGRDEGDGAPVVFAKLDRTMSPADVAKLFPGAEKVSQFGISTVKVKDVPGVASYEFHFQKDKLYSATINFKTSLTTAAFGEYLRKVVLNKWGPKGDDGSNIITYAMSDGRMIQSSKFVDHYRVDFTPAR